MTESTNNPAHGSLAGLATAVWGACWGILLASATTAALIVATADTRDHEHPGVLPSESMNAFVRIPWQERYERVWYALVCVCGALGGWVATRWVRPCPWSAGAASVAFVPVAAAACARVFSPEPSLHRLVLAAGILLLPFFRRSNATAVQVRPGPVGPQPRLFWVKAGVLCLPLGGFVYSLFAPYDLTTTASRCYTESHVGSYLVGPALYYRAPDAVPGLDFESHYGIGHAYTFSLVSGSRGFERTMERYVLFVLVVIVLYFLSAFLVIADWLRNPWAAAGLTLGLVGLSFEGASYLYPSNWAIRHPFVFLFLFALVRGCEVSREGRGWCLAAGGLCGLSLWWQTDTGLYTLAAGVALFAVNRVFNGGPVWRGPVFLLASLGTFSAVCLALFGPRTLSVTFVGRLLEPLLLYGTGFGNQLLNWESGWGLWYNLAGPGLAVASVGLLMGYRRGETLPRGVLYAAGASLLGLAMLFKWVNRSIDVLWSLNGSLVVAVTGYWLWVCWCRLAGRLGSDTRPAVGYARLLAAGAALVGLVILGWREDRRLASPEYQGGSSSPLVRIEANLDRAESVFNQTRRDLRPDPRPSGLDRDTITFLRANTRRGDRVAVVCWEDWNYLAAAGRAPRLHWVQLFLVHSPVLLDRCAADLRAADMVFVHRDALVSLAKVNPAAYNRVARVLDEDFGPGEWTPCQWLLYHHKPGPTAAR